MNDTAFPAFAAAPVRPAPDAQAPVRTLDAAAYPTLDDLAAALAADPAPALVLVATPQVEAQVLPRLRPEDDVARADDGPVALELRARRLQERHRVALELAQRRAHVDPLTGLPDRLRCLEWFSVDENAWAGDRTRALLLLDLDVFHDVNERVGREGGDRLLVEIARSLRNAAQPGDLVYRLEFDEFVIVMERASRDALIRDAEAFRAAVHAATCTTETGTAQVTASGGVAFLRASGFRYAALQQADTAMYMAKILGRDTLVLHDDVRHLAVAHGTTLELSDLSEQADAAKARLESMAGEFNRRLLAKAQREATVDPLTQVHNRRYFDTRITREMEMAARGGRPLSLVFLDIDDFRLVNHEYGHPTGDIALRRFTQIINTCIRDADWLARYGGEEFCLVMPVGMVEARRVATRIVEAVAKASFATLDGRPFAITASAGVVTYDPASDRDADHFVDRGSKANRAAKDAGKNRVV
ncbi:MAG: GGDEF domain-containing protein [Burkholderiales bacterium]